MKKPVKFATQIDETVLKDLRQYSKLTDRSLSSIVSEAVAEYILKSQLRPAFKTALEEVLNENEELLKRLAK